MSNTGIEIQDEKSYLKKLAGTETKTEYATKYNTKAEVATPEISKSETKEIEKTLKVVEEAREVIRTRYLNGDWAGTVDNNGKETEETRYCALGALGHVQGAKDHDLGESYAQEMFKENNFLFKAFAYAFRNQLPDDFDEFEIDESDGPEKPEPPQEPKHPIRPADADTNEDSDLAYKIKLEEYSDEMKYYNEQLEDYKDELAEYEKELKEYQEDQERIAKEDKCETLVEAVYELNDETNRSRVLGKFDSALAFLKKMVNKQK